MAAAVDGGSYSDDGVAAEGHANEEGAPLPYVRVDWNYLITYRSRMAAEMFPNTASFLEWTDIGSILKVKECVRPGAGPSKLELNLITASGERSLFDVYQRWDPQGVGHLSLVRSQSSMDGLLERIAEVREQMGRTSFLPIPSLSSQRNDEDHRRQSDTIDELKRHLDTARDLLSLLRNDLLEAGKGTYEALILDQIDEAERLANLMKE